MTFAFALIPLTLIGITVSAVFAGIPLDVGRIEGHRRTGGEGHYRHHRGGDMTLSAPPHETLRISPNASHRLLLAAVFVTIYIAPCLFCAIENCKWKRAQRLAGKEDAEFPKMEAAT